MVGRRSQRRGNRGKVGVFAQPARINRRRNTAKITSSTIDTSKQVTIETGKQLRVNLDKSFVEQYLRDQKENAVQFVSESVATPKTKKIAQLSALIFKMKKRQKALIAHVRSLQSRLINQINVIDIDEAEHSGTGQTNDIVQNEPELELNASWVDRQIKEWTENRELTRICNDFVEFLNENIDLDDD